MANADLKDRNAFFTFGGLIANGSAPTAALGSGADLSGLITVTGKDSAGYVTLSTGASTSGSNATIFTMTFGAALPNSCKSVSLEPGNASACALVAACVPYVDQASLSTASWTLKSGATALTASTTYIWFYSVIG